MAKKKLERASESTEKKRLILLDSHAILHRAYHAIPDFATSTGEATGALYGLVTMLLKTIDELSPDYLIAARDLPAGLGSYCMLCAWPQPGSQPEQAKQQRKLPKLHLKVLPHLTTDEVSRKTLC